MKFLATLNYLVFLIHLSNFAHLVKGGKVSGKKIKSFISLDSDRYRETGRLKHRKKN
jgi:hypothetical protein